MRFHTLAIAALTAFSVVMATPASAELIFFATGRSMSVASHRVDGDRMIIRLRGGGEMSFDRSLIVKVAPDEVPYLDARSGEGDARAALSGQPGGVRLIESTPFDPLIEEASRQYDVDPRIVKAVIQVESSFKPRARSSKGAMGLMQLMPDTARQYDARRPYDPKSNILAGTRYLSALLTEFDLPLALAAYNAGEGAVRRFRGIPPYAETQAYVSKILALLGGVSFR